MSKVKDQATQLEKKSRWPKKFNRKNEQNLMTDRDVKNKGQSEENFKYVIHQSASS